jgi:hypothetical protein
MLNFEYDKAFSLLGIALVLMIGRREGYPMVFPIISETWAAGHLPNHFQSKNQENLYCFVINFLYINLNPGLDWTCWADWCNRSLHPAYCF